jgi:SRSO17 transposase
MTLHPSISQPVLDEFFLLLGRLLGRKERRASFAIYAMGLLSDLERKSAEPIAALVCKNKPRECAKTHDHLLHFLGSSPWDDGEVRLVATDFALDEVTKTEPLESYILDDTGFLKQGTESVGVQRQYTGSAGKIANCQIAVSLTVATASTHLPLDLGLYLPQNWTQDDERCQKAGVPEHIRFCTKHDIALDLLAASLVHGRPSLPVLADAAYGNNSLFRGEVTRLGLPYAMGINATTTVRVVDKKGRLGPVVSVKQAAEQQRKSIWEEVTWLEGTKAALSSRFALLEVEVADPNPREPARQRLLIEWPEGQKEPEHYTLVTVATVTTLKQVVRLVKSRWRTERVYEDMKGELGLDHFEGRSWLGWNHHVSVALVCYAVVVACQRRAFPSSGRGSSEGSVHSDAA